MLNLKQEYLGIVMEILNKLAPDCEIYAFGSRVEATAREFSDLDLLLIGAEKIDIKRIEKIKDAFSESNLPIMVDVVDWHTLSKEFKEIIAKKRVFIRNKMLG